MKNLRDVSKNFAELIPIPKEIKKKYSHLNYDSCLHIRIYGTPFSDSRPRLNQKTGGVGLKNINLMKKVFTPLYKSSELLQNLTIVSPYHIQGKFYRKPTSNDMKFINKSSSKIKKLYEQKKLGDLSIKDTDNMLKIHNDILFSAEYRITLDDAWNIGFLEPEKYLSDVEYADIFVYYSSKPNAYYVYKMRANHSYFEWLVSEKHMKINHRTNKEQLKHLKSTIRDEINCSKNEEAVRTIMKRAFAVLEEYPAELIKSIADMQDFKYTKADAQFKIMSICCKGHSVAEKILERGKHYYE